MTAYGHLNRSGFALPAHWLHLEVDNLTAGEKTTKRGALLKGDIILGAYVNVITPEATASTKTIDVGLDGSGADNDPDGFLDGVSTATAGLIKGTLASAGQTVGALLRVDESGAGVLVPEGHVITQDDAVVTYTLGEEATELVAEILILVLRPPFVVA
jgi:hypothetical protein